jgi:kinetochore protein NDC80
VRTLIEFLTYHNYDHAISPKILNSPSGKDFNNIVQFLFRLIDQNLSCPGKFEDEVIQMFKYLRYPYSISKNGLSAVGSPHSWPQLLASLMWVIELLEYDEEVMNNNENDDIMNDDADLEDPSTSEKAFFSYLRNAYVSFLGGDDDAYNDLTDEFTQSFQSKNTDIVAQTDALEDQNAELLKEIAEVESRRLVLPQLQTKKRDYENDKGKFENLIAQLEKHKEACQSKIDSRMSELQKTKASIKTVDENIEVLKEKIAVQELSPEDVKRMSEEREHLQESLLTTSEASSTLQKKVWDAELVLRDRVQSMEEAVRLFNSMADDLDYAMDAAQMAASGTPNQTKSPSKLSKRQLSKAIANVKINIDIRAKKRSELIQTDIRKDVIPPLHQLKVMLSDVMVALNGEIIALQDASEEEELRTVQVQEAKLLLESKLRRAEEAYKKEKTALESLAGSHDREMDELESKLIALRDVTAAEVRQVSANRKVSELKTLKSSNRDNHKKKKKEMIASIMQVVTAAANHREHTQMRLGQLTEMHRQRLESLLLLGGSESVSEGWGYASSSSSSNTACRSPFLDCLPVPPTHEEQEYEQMPEQNIEEDTDLDDGVNDSLFHDDDALGGGGIRPNDDSGMHDDNDDENDMRFVSNLNSKFNMDDLSA